MNDTYVCEVLQEFDSLLLSLFLMMKNSAVKTNIFEEMQKVYVLMPLKLVKAAVTRWLSHGKACDQVLDRFKSLVLALDEIYERKNWLFEVFQTSYWNHNQLQCFV